jgi:hypothetical protein
LADADLNAAACAARYLASSISGIRGMAAAGLPDAHIRRLAVDLNDAFEKQSDAIRTVELELRATRQSVAHFGDLISPSAHEIAIEMVFAFNLERFGPDIVVQAGPDSPLKIRLIPLDRKRIVAWPDLESLLAEIDLETARAQGTRNQAKSHRLPDSTVIPSTTGAESDDNPPGVAEVRPVSRKRSTEKGEALVKIVAALTKHHDYDSGSSLKLTPVGVNELARTAKVSASTVSHFFKTRFEGYTKYRAVCRDGGRLADSIKALNGEFSPHDLYGRRPPNEDDRDDE